MMLPPLRSTIWTGTEMLYPNASLFSTFTSVNRTTFSSQIRSGTRLGCRYRGGFEASKRVRRPSRAMKRNWEKVTRRPVMGVRMGGARGWVRGVAQREDDVRAYRDQVAPCSSISRLLPRKLWPFPRHATDSLQHCLEHEDLPFTSAFRNPATGSLSART